MIYILNSTNNGKKPIKYGIFTFLFSILLTIQAGASETSQSSDTIFVTANFKETTLSDTLADLSMQTGYKFEIPEEWSEIEISGEFIQVDLHKFFSRVMKDGNFSLIIDEEEKTVIVKDLGGSSKIQKTIETVKVTKAIDPESGMLKEDLNKLHAQQLDATQQHKANPDAIDPMSGLANNTLKELHQQQMEQRERTIQDGSAVDPMSGIPLTELERLHKEQRANLKSN